VDEPAASGVLDAALSMTAKQAVPLIHACVGLAATCAAFLAGTATSRSVPVRRGWWPKRPGLRLRTELELPFNEESASFPRGGFCGAHACLVRGLRRSARRMVSLTSSRLACSAACHNCRLTFGSDRSRLAFRGVGVTLIAITDLPLLVVDHS